MLCNDGLDSHHGFWDCPGGQCPAVPLVGFTPTMGTPDYMAPEQVKGSRGDERTDIYSLGAILYGIGHGRTAICRSTCSPYVIMNARVTGDPRAPRKIYPKLTPVLEEIILHAMERDPKRRYRSASEMKKELDRLRIRGDDQPSHPVAGAPGCWKSWFRMSR